MNGNASDLTERDRLIKVETEVSVIKDAVLELKMMLIEFSKRDEKYVLKETLDEHFRLRDQRQKESDKKVDDYSIKFEQKVELINLKVDQKIEAINVKLEANTVGTNVKFEKLETDKKENRRKFPEWISSILQSAVIIAGVIVYLTHK